MKISNFLTIAVLIFLGSAGQAEEQTTLTFPCFESMARVQEKSVAIPLDISGPARVLIARAEADALTRAKKGNQAYTPFSAVEILQIGFIQGIKVFIGSSTNDQYADYFLYSVTPANIPNSTNTTDDKIELLSAHLGDDQGPELVIYCKGWSEGLAIP